MSTGPLALLLDGEQVNVDVDHGRSLVDVLRLDLGKRGTHLGCGNGDCGACTVLIDGDTYKACLVPCGRADTRRVDTVEGLADKGVLHPVQQAFWDANAFQCGFCLPGHLLCTVALSRTAGPATAAEVDEAIAGNLCRCTGYQQIRRAALAATSTTGHRPVADREPPPDPVPHDRSLFHHQLSPVRRADPRGHVRSRPAAACPPAEREGPAHDRPATRSGSDNRPT